MKMFSYRQYHLPEIVFSTIEDIKPLTKEKESSSLKTAVINYLNEELWRNKI